VASLPVHFDAGSGLPISMEIVTSLTVGVLRRASATRLAVVSRESGLLLETTDLDLVHPPAIPVIETWSTYTLVPGICFVFSLISLARSVVETLAQIAVG